LRLSSSLQNLTLYFSNRPKGSTGMQNWSLYQCLGQNVVPTTNNNITDVSAAALFDAVFRGLKSLETLTLGLNGFYY